MRSITTEVCWRSPANVVNLTDALKRSIQDTGAGKSKTAKAPAKKAEAAARQKKKARG
jgi:non-homologous end joining protein Ku